MTLHCHLLCAKETYGRKKHVELGPACRSVLGNNFLFDIESIKEGAQWYFGLPALFVPPISTEFPADVKHTLCSVLVWFVCSE